MQARELPLEKIEHAVLWSLARQDYERFATLGTIRAQLLDVTTPQRINAALRHLIDCGLVDDLSAPEQEHYEASREGHIRIDKLVMVPVSFVGRLNIHGPKWLASTSAHSAELQSEFRRPTRIAPSREQAPATSPVNIYNQVNPSIQNTISERLQGDESLTRSARNAGWFGAWGSWVGVVVAVAALVAALWLAGRI